MFVRSYTSTKTTQFMDSRVHLVCNSLFSLSNFDQIDRFDKCDIDSLVRGGTMLLVISINPQYKFIFNTHIIKYITPHLSMLHLISLFITQC